MDQNFSYDEVAYPSFVFQHIRPDRIGAIGILHGLDIPKIDNARILELGCGDGAHLISIAHSMPNSQCIGLDLSIERIKDARKFTDEIGVSNIEFRQADVMDMIPADLGKFDFIIAHGLFSWVPELVREKVLDIYRECLKPTGIGYISYNAYPGWHLRGFIRDAMRFQSALIGGADEKVRSAMNFLRFLRESTVEDSVFQKFLDAEIVASEDRPPENIFHDELADINQPFYFTEFVEMIERHGLSYVAESEPISAFERRFPDFAREALENLGDDYVRREQYKDFMRAKRFRGSLVCLAESKPVYRADPSRIDPLYVATKTALIEKDANLSDDSTVAFTGPLEAEFTLNHPFVKTALAHVGSRWPERVPFLEVVEYLNSKFPEADAEFRDNAIRLLRLYLVELFHSTGIELRCFDPRFQTTVSERPEVSRFARWQAEKNYDYVNGLTGVSMGIRDEAARRLLIAADGTRDRSWLIAEVEPILLRDTETEGLIAETFVDNNLETFKDAGLLVC